MKNIGSILILSVGFLMFTSCGESQPEVEGEIVETSKDQVEEVIEEAKPLKQTAENVDVEKFEYMIGHGNGLLLDVRTPEEFEEGHIEGATLINFFDPDFADQIEKLDKTRAVYVYCKAGGRSARAMQMMNELGFLEVYNLSGGYGAWSSK